MRVFRARARISCAPSPAAGDRRRRLRVSFDAPDGLLSFAVGTNATIDSGEPVLTPQARLPLESDGLRSSGIATEAELALRDRTL